MHKKSFWRGYLLGLLLALGMGFGGIYYLFFHQPDISLPAMRLVELDGRPVDVMALAGKPVVVNYWATWCRPCVEEFPIFEQCAQHSGAATTFLMASDEPAAKVRAFCIKHPYHFRFVRAAQPLPGVNTRPVTYGFDRHGQLVSKHSGTITGPALAEFINSL